MKMDGKKIDRIADTVCIVVMTAIVIAAMVCAFRGCFGYDAMELEAKLERARAEGAARAEAKAAACGGWDGFGGYTHRMVNQWCRENGRDDAYPGEGSLDKDGKPID